jgi:hypothetical protein
MKKEQIKKLLNEDHKIKVFITINNKSDKMILKTWIHKNNECYEVYYNHIKSFLNPNQIRFIKAFKKAKNITFQDLISANMDVKTMHSALKKLEYLEQD